MKKGATLIATILILSLLLSQRSTTRDAFARGTNKKVILDKVDDSTKILLDTLLVYKYRLDSARIVSVRKIKVLKSISYRLSQTDSTSVTTRKF